MMKYFNLHTHCNYCDGAGFPEEYVNAAIKKQFHTLGFSSHAPVPFKNTFAIRDEQELQKYCDQIIHLKEIYKDKIDIYLGLELDYIEGISGDFGKIKEKYGLDYTIGSVHLVRNRDDENLWFIDGPRVESYDGGLKSVFKGDVKQAVTTYYEQVKKMVVTQKPDILGHFDKIKMHNKDRYFKEDEAWYRDLVMDLLDAISTTGVIPEVNTRGIYKKRSSDLYPGVWILKEMKKMNIPVILSTDAHHPGEIDGYYDEAVEILKEIGYKSLVCYNVNGWQELPI
ncbi:MAG: histidinol-phosphatase [Bacteroidales bacterium]|jgi:histidinol-phosphatase (PHP family)|nr:histidinol-phosphatase [Bacteroidales bacterium]